MDYIINQLAEKYIWMYKDTIERSKHKHSHVIVLNRSKKGSPSVKGSPGVHRESIGIKLY